MDTNSPASAEPASLVEQALCQYRTGDLESAALWCERALALSPAHAAALNLAGIIAFARRDLERARERFAAAVRAAPESVLAHVHLGNAQLELHDPGAALASYGTALALDQICADAHYGRGSALFDLNRLEEALASFDAAIAARPEFAAAHDNRALTLYRLRRFEAAAAGFRQTLMLSPDAAIAHYHLGIALIAQKRAAEALESFDSALRLFPDYTEALNGRGNALAALRRPEEALVHYERAIALNTGLAAAHTNRGKLLADLDRDQEALASYQRALECAPRSADVYTNLSALLRKMCHLQAAIGAADRAIALDPKLPDAFYNRGIALLEMRDFDAAVAAFDSAIALRADFDEAFLQRGQALRAAADNEGAIDSFARALALNPELKFLPGLLRHMRMRICDWEDFDQDVAQITASVSRQEPVCYPFCLHALVDDPVLHLAAARTWVEQECAVSGELGSVVRPTSAQRVRVGYFSSDIRWHPVASSIAEVIEHHDRVNFEISVFSFGPNTDDPMRRRIEWAAEHFLDVRERSDRDIATLARARNLDIAVDLNGYTEHSRPRIFALRAAPLQIGYIGFLGTSGAPYMDYLLADEALIPPAQRDQYSERILYLPSYQANDSSRKIAGQPSGRLEVGLPEKGFVFCCFNNTYKITPATFASWMRILIAVPGSVLLLYLDNSAVERNLRREAARCAVAPERLIFGGRLPHPEHLARCRLADLFLDTSPYNAGATASDALWAGLPVLTCRGRSMQARMASSLLIAAGLPELITDSPGEYERRAIELAHDSGTLGSLRDRLAAHRFTCALFDTRRFTRHLEQAYRRVSDALQ